MTSSHLLLNPLGMLTTKAPLENWDNIDIHPHKR